MGIVAGAIYILFVPTVDVWYSLFIVMLHSLLFLSVQTLIGLLFIKLSNKLLQLRGGELMRTWLKILILVATTLFLAVGCSNGENNYSADKKKEIDNDTMTGYLTHIDTSKSELNLDITKWVNRENTGEVVDIQHSKTIIYNKNTTFQDEQGANVDPEDFKKGEKLAVYETSETTSSSNESVFKANNIIQLNMSRQEKLDRFLAKGDNLHTVLLYQEGTTPPYDEMDFEKFVPESFSGGISWVPYVEGLAIDYKEELNIEKLPMIMVFDRDGVVFKTDSIEQLKSWSEENR